MGYEKMSTMMTLKKRGGLGCRRSAAFTLVEVMVGVAIIGIAFVSLYTGISSGVQVIQLARENLRATQIMVEKMETIRLKSWEQVTGGQHIPPKFTENFYPAGVTSKGITYYGTTVVTNFPFSTSYKDDVRMVIVTLTWTNFNVPRVREMRTLVAKDGMQNYVF